jgi:hypothetical protein
VNSIGAKAIWYWVILREDVCQGMSLLVPKVLSSSQTMTNIDTAPSFISEAGDHRIVVRNVDSGRIKFALASGSIYGQQRSTVWRPDYRERLADLRTTALLESRSSAGDLSVHVRNRLYVRS